MRTNNSQQRKRKESLSATSKALLHVGFKMTTLPSLCTKSFALQTFVSFGNRLFTMCFCVIFHRTCPSTFDEKLMFKDPASAKILKVGATCLLLWEEDDILHVVVILFYRCVARQWDQSMCLTMAFLCNFFSGRIQASF